MVLDEITNVAYISQSNGDNLSVLGGRGIDQHLAIVHAAGQVEYGLSDAVNSTVETVDQAGAKIAAFLYEPFGQTIASGSTYPFQFTGRIPASASLYYYRARFYSPSMGRFISEDPIGFAGQGTSLYAYVENDPVDSVDPTGLLGVPTFGPVKGPIRVPIRPLPPIGPGPLPVPIPVGICQAGGNPPCKLIYSVIVPHWNKRQCTYLCGSFTLHRFVLPAESCPVPQGGWVPGSPTP